MRGMEFSQTLTESKKVSCANQHQNMCITEWYTMECYFCNKISKFTQLRRKSIFVGVKMKWFIVHCSECFRREV